MTDHLPRDYDAWRTRNAEDDADEKERKRAIREAREDQADYENDARKDEGR